MTTCVKCQQEDNDLDFVGRCLDCFKKDILSNGPTNGLPYFKEMGVENPADPQGSTAHVRDIKARRLDVKTNETYYDKGRTSYFFPKGKS
jgi:hypothetical protein